MATFTSNLSYHKENTLIISSYISTNGPATEILQLLELVLNMILQRKVLTADLNADFSENR
jgi:hypothetical protein